MGQLQYNHRSYFRSSESEAESFRPYLVSIIAIVVFTWVVVGIQYIKQDAKVLGAKTSEPLSTICSESSAIDCPKPTAIKQLTLH